MAAVKPVGRFAPTPSGRMHLGNVFAALIAWLSVRSRDGEMVLRMEDLDTQRTSAEYAQVLREDLAWLGLDYDRETPPQSQRAEVYDRYFQQLRERGLLYPCYCTRSQLPRHLPQPDITPCRPAAFLAGDGAGQGLAVSGSGSGSVFFESGH